MTLFTSLYQTLLLSALLQEKELMPFTSAHEVASLVGKGDYKIVTYTVQYKTFWFYNDLKTSEHVIYSELRDSLRSNPLIIKDTLEEALGLLNHGRYIYITQEDGLGSMEIKQLCHMVVFKKGIVLTEFISPKNKIVDLPEKSGHYLFLPGNPLIKRWNEAIIMNGDFIRRTYYKYFQANFELVPFPRCSSLTKYSSEAERPLGMRVFTFYSIFY